MNNTIGLRHRVSAVGVVLALTLAGSIISSAPASASAAGDEFKACLTSYKKLSDKFSGNLQNAIWFTGQYQCNYNLSQRSDIAGETEVIAVRNAEVALGNATKYIIKVGVKAYEKVFTKGLKPIKI